MKDNLYKFTEVRENLEHPIENFLIYKKYISTIENSLESKIIIIKIIKDFLIAEKISPEKLIDSCTRIKEINENSLYCLDYILASIEYDDFFNLMIDYKVLLNKYHIIKQNLENIQR